MDKNWLYLAVDRRREKEKILAKATPNIDVNWLSGF